MAKKKQRHRRVRGRFSVLYKVFSIVLILLALVVGSVVFFRVQTVSVAGNVRYTEEEIVAATGIQKGDNLFFMNRYGVEKNLRSAMPYLDSVAVQQKLPDTILITVRETVAAATVAGEGEWWVLDAGGKLLERRETAPTEGYCVIRGVVPLAPAEGTDLAVTTEERPALTALEGLLAALEQEGLLAKTNYIDITDGYRIDFSYDSRFIVTVPTSADFAYRMRFFREALESGRAVEGQKYEVDMSIEGETRFIPIS